MILSPMAGNNLETQFQQDSIHRMSNNMLSVGNLSFNTTDRDLQDAFAAYGTVVATNLMTDRTTGRPFGFVTMSSDEEAGIALAALNGKSLDGRVLTVNAARPRENGVH